MKFLNPSSDFDSSLCRKERQGGILHALLKMGTNFAGNFPPGVHAHLRLRIDFAMRMNFA